MKSLVGGPPLIEGCCPGALPRSGLGWTCPPHFFPEGVSGIELLWSVLISFRLYPRPYPTTWEGALLPTPNPYCPPLCLTWRRPCCCPRAWCRYGAVFEDDLERLGLGLAKIMLLTSLVMGPAGVNAAVMYCAGAAAGTYSLPRHSQDAAPFSQVRRKKGDRPVWQWLTRWRHRRERSGCFTFYHCCSRLPT